MLLYAFTLLTLVASAIAAVYAIKSYRGIGRQIDLAKDQLKAANDQLGLAREELSAVTQDLEYSREQSSYVRTQLRSPDDVLIIKDVGRVPVGNNLAAVLMVSLTNVGLRTSTKAHGYVLIPTHLGTIESPVRHSQNGVEYYQYDVNVPSEVWPDQLVNDVARFTVRAIPGQWKVLWRVYDDFGGYPEGPRQYAEVTMSF